MSMKTARRCQVFWRQYSTFVQHRQAITDRNSDVNAFVHVEDEPPPAISSDSPLSGVCIGLKDNIATRDSPTTCSSAMLKNYTSPFDATVVRLLRDAGAWIIGKTNCDEFGMGSLNIHSTHGPVVNPFSRTVRRSAGGSSGGSAAAVAAGMCFAALGTDTGGSIRLPAAYCGVTGLKPSYGLVSRWGVVSYADSLDCVGVLAADVSRTRRVFHIISKHDSKDPTVVEPDIRHRASQATRERLESITAESSPDTPLKGLRIGVPQEYFPVELSREEILDSMRRVIYTLQEWGATVIPVSLPSTEYALSAYYVLASAEASSNLARYDGVRYGLRVPPPPNADLRRVSQTFAYTRSTGFGPEVQKRILLGTYALTAEAFNNYFLQAQRIRSLIQADFSRVFSVPDFRSRSAGQLGTDIDAGGVDVLLHPSAIRTAPLLPDAETEDAGGLETYVQDVCTVPASLGGLPALSVPVPTVGWPIGLSVVAQWGCDEMALMVGEEIERAGATMGKDARTREVK